MSILLAILVFGLLIFIHELGHFAVAKASGIVVNSFSIGFGPALIKKQIGETLYAIRIIPFGGAVEMKGEISEDDTEPTEEELEGSFLSAKPIIRLLVCIAGAFMNFLLGIVIIFFIMLPAETTIAPEITFLEPDFEYGEYFQVGDVIKKVDDFHVFTYNDLSSGLGLNKDGTYDFTIIRDGEKIKYDDLALEKKIFGDETTPRYGFSFGVKELSFTDKIKETFNNSASFVQSVYVSLKYMVTGNVQTSDMMGAVGITNEISDRAKSSMADMWYFVAFLSINLAVVNMLPFFALDGGKCVLILWEMITKKPIKPKYEAYLNLIGMVLLLGLFVFVTFNDVLRLIRG
ncbi:MAG: site-2 protease family protein [Clostridia bacterium]|nr:site-2 protease family protein [Clostridia bacterium]